MMTLFYILDLKWGSFGLEVRYEDLLKTTRLYIEGLVEQVGEKMSKKWCYVINLIKGFEYIKLFESEEEWISAH
ncbi:MAG: hypothetical protein WC503_06035 [Candidatus Shapirobacteria bacterium]